MGEVSQTLPSSISRGGKNRFKQKNLPPRTEAGSRSRNIVGGGTPRHRAENCGSNAMAQKTVSRLPLSLAPRGLSRGQAAEYIGVGVTKFGEMVDDGRMPKPKRIDSRTVWDRIKLDEAFAALDDEAEQRNEWDDL